jgi:hypothetical protein
LQGKHEQAQAVRTSVLKETPVPWPVLDESRLRELTVKVFRAPARRAAAQSLIGARCQSGWDLHGVLGPPALGGPR